MKLHAPAAAALLLVACAVPPGTSGPCDEPGSVELGESELPVPAGTRQIRCTTASAAQRTRQLVFEPELVLSGAFGSGFYRPGAIAMTDDGDIYVLDRGNSRVVVFDRRGNALRQFGREGQGPGEFQAPGGIGVVGDRVVVYQPQLRRINVFSVTGEHVADHVLGDYLWVADAVGVGSNVLLVSPAPTPVPIRAGSTAPVVPWVIGVYAPDGTEQRRILETEDSARARFVTGELAGTFTIAAAHPRAALAPDGLAYATPGSGYEVVAVDAGGTFHWLLRGDLQPVPLTDAHKDRVTAAFLERYPDEVFAETIWPDRFAAIVNLETDGAGNVYVFPYDHETYFEADVAREPPAAPVPVDVYSAAGERLFEGRINLPSWDAQRDDRVCRVEPDAESGEEVVVCYRVAVIS